MTKAKPDNLEIFLYILLRDHLPAGKVESILEWHVDVARDQTTKTIVYSNSQLFSYAKSLAKRLKK